MWKVELRSRFCVRIALNGCSAKGNSRSCRTRNFKVELLRRTLQSTDVPSFRSFPFLRGGHVRIPALKGAAFIIHS